MNEKILHSKRYWAVVIFAVAAVVAVFVMRPAKKNFHKSEGVIWTTEYHMTYEASVDLTDSIAAVLARVDSSANVYNKSSLVSRLNVNSTNRVDSIFMRMYATALVVNKESQGVYDPTVMPLVNAWGFGYKNGALPTRAQLDSILAFVGLTKTHLESEKLVKSDDRIQFDFSSIAKGLAVDEVGRMFKRNGVTNYMVEIGGEVVAEGHNDKGTPWNISVDLPVADDTSVEHISAMTLSLNKKGIATSGNYRKYKEVDGKKVSHIVNPLTGMSEESSLLSATVVASDCMTADAWATACMAMGTERTQALFEHRTDLAVMTISADADGNFVVWSNAPFAKMVNISK